MEKNDLSFSTKDQIFPERYGLYVQYIRLRGTILNFLFFFLVFSLAPTPFLIIPAPSPSSFPLGSSGGRRLLEVAQRRDSHPDGHGEGLLQGQQEGLHPSQHEQGWTC